MRMMFRQLMLSLFLGIGVLGSAPSWGQLWSVAQVKDHPGQFTTGVASGILAHELGHVLVASAKGYDVGLDGLTIVYPNARMADNDALQVSSAGLQTQWLVSEAVLRPHESAHTPLNNTEAGLVCAHLGITAAYLLALKDYPHNDASAIAEASGLSTDQVLLLITVPAALDYWRLTGRNVPAWVPVISTSIKGIGISATWTF